MLKFTMFIASFVFAGQLYAAEKFVLKSQEVAAGASLGVAQVANSFGCTGNNIAPSFTWQNAPKETRSFALMAYDPDAPTGSGFWHWVVFNIPATTTSLPANSGVNGKVPLPAGAIESRTDVGVPGFLGACPPKGDKPHRYQFTLYALSVESLPLTADTTPAIVGFNVRSHTLAKAQIEAVYQRN
jgi:Raf kinase inhibitor-like YbhB/YbcL family protein